MDLDHSENSFVPSFFFFYNQERESENFPPLVCIEVQSKAQGTEDPKKILNLLRYSPYGVQ